LSCLIYCVIKGPAPAIPATLTGVEGQPVFLVPHQGLAAAVSRVEAGDDLTPTLERIRAYEQVVARLHRERTVIPMRYGCRAPDEARVVRLLEERQAQYLGLLEELEGCVEMGLRIRLSEVKASPGLIRGRGNSPDSGSPAKPGASQERPGLSYLQGRKVHYEELEQWTREYRRIAAQCLTYLAGWFTRSKTEGPSPQLPLLSLYFLVPQEALEGFRRGVRSFRPGGGVKLLLSGPWPPYNFVVDEPSPDGMEGGDG
jgi:hypothetical protein